MSLFTSPGYFELKATPEEEQAIRLRWTEVEKREGTPDLENAQRLLGEIRERVAAIEREAVAMATQEMSEGRRTPRRKQRVALVVLALMVVIIVVITQFVR